MKTFLYYTFAAFLLIAGSVYAQEKPKQQRNSGTQETEQSTSERGANFVDEDGDGINDNSQQKQDTEGNRQQVRERRRDQFIDTDGDGINDERCSGMGVRSGQRRGQQKGGGS